MPVKLVASRLASLLEILYAFMLAFEGNVSAKKELAKLASSIEIWAQSIPELALALDKVTDKNEANRTVAELALGKALSLFLRQTAKTDLSFETAELKTLRYFARYFKAKPDKVKEALDNSASLYSSFAASQFIRNKNIISTDVIHQLKDLVQEISGKRQTYLEIETSKQVASEHPAQYKQYQALKKTFNAQWQKQAKNYIRKSGGKVDYEKLYNYLQNLGISGVLPKGFTGKIDDQFRWYTQDGVLLDVPPTFPTYKIIKMNPRPTKTNNWIAKTDPTTGSGSTKYIYTQEFQSQQANHKYENVTKLLEILPQARQVWRNNIKNFDPNSEKDVSSCLLELLLINCARIGTLGNTTQGMGTLRAKNASWEVNGDLVLEYKGKDGIDTRHVIKNVMENRSLIEAMHELIDGKDPERYIFTAGGKFVRLQNTRNYFKQLTGIPDITPHKLRTYAGTKVFKQLLDKITELPTTQKEANALYNEMTKIVGQKLNHIRNSSLGVTVTGLTAAKSYIDPMLQVAYWDKVGFRCPAFLEKLRNKKEA